MAWMHYRLCFRLLSPLHVGHRRVGNLMQTKPYVPGKPLWAALTARLTRDRDPSKDYRNVGAQIEKNFRFGYLWPSLDRDRPWFPWDHEDFDYVFLGSYVSTALDYGREAAEEGTLHEVEYLSPYTRGEGRPVYLVGDLWVQAQDSLPDEPKGWQEALEKVQLGGERAYGWGRVQLVAELKEGGGRRDGGLTVTGFRWEERNGEVWLRVNKGARLTSPVLAGSLTEDEVGGPVEVLSGWERDNEKPGRIWHLSEVKLVYAPEARAKKDLTLKVDHWGVLHKVRDAAKHSSTP